MIRKLAFISLILCLTGVVGTLHLAAQSNELGVTVGGYFPFNSQSGAGTAFAAGGSFAHRILGVPLASLYFEIPVYGTFNSVTDIVSTTQGRAKYSGLFVTPGLKLKLAPGF